MIKTENIIFRKLRIWSKLKVLFLEKKLFKDKGNITYNLKSLLISGRSLIEDYTGLNLSFRIFVEYPGHKWKSELACVCLSVYVCVRARLYVCGGRKVRLHKEVVSAFF